MNSKMPKSFIAFILTIGLLVCMFVTPHAAGSESVTEIFLSSINSETIPTYHTNQSTQIQSTVYSTNGQEVDYSSFTLDELIDLFAYELKNDESEELKTIAYEIENSSDKIKTLSELISDPSLKIPENASKILVAIKEKIKDLYAGEIATVPSSTTSTTNVAGSIPLPPTGGGVHNQITFGSYPQSEVSDEVLLLQLNSLTLNWKSYGYYYGNGTYGSMQQSDYMKYADIEYNGCKYRAVTFSEYRPLNTYGKIEPLYTDFISHQHSNGYYINNVYWFKYEPLVWLVLDEETNLLLCQSVIDSQPYTNTIYRLTTDSVEYEGWIEYSYEYYNDSEMTTYANDYVTSSIRKWLNDDFYNTAFTDEEKQQVAVTPRDNGYLEDKIFLLSKDEATNPDYGFYSMEYDADYRPELITFASDYAKSQGLFSGYAAGGVSLMSQGRASKNENCTGVVFEGEYQEVYNGGWYLRTPSSSSSHSVMGGDSCYITSFVVDVTCVGVRPAIVLGEEVEEPEEELTCCQKICKFFSSLWDCICNFFSKIIAIIIETFTVIC